MAWQADSTSGSPHYRELLTQIVAMATSQHVSAVVINAAGTGYVAAEILTITHAGANMDCSIEILTVGGSGEILTVKLRNMGAFSNRLASVTINAGGTGYAVSDVLEIQGGTSTEKGKATVSTVSGGVITAVAMFETGGAYTVAPSATAAATLGIGPTAYAGNDDATIDTTMTGLIGTTGAAATGGSGSSATFDLTLTATGWSAVRNTNDWTFNALTNEKEVVLLGTVAGGDAPFVGFRSFTGTDGGSTRYGLQLSGMTSHNPALAYTNQTGYGPIAGDPNDTNGSYLVMFDNANANFWLSIDGRRILIINKAVGGATTSYISTYVGLLAPLATTVENPYPLVIGASCCRYRNAPDEGSDEITGLTECTRPDPTAGGPCYFRRITDGLWKQIINNDNGSINSEFNFYPIGQTLDISDSNSPGNLVRDGGFTWFDGIALNTGAAATRIMKPTTDSGDDIFSLIPVLLINTPDATNTINVDINGELDNVFWLSATKTDGLLVTVEDTTTIGSDRYKIFACGHRREQYSFFAVKEA